MKYLRLLFGPALGEIRELLAVILMQWACALMSTQSLQELAVNYDFILSQIHIRLKEKKK